jgi:hypothetical protein
MFWPKKGKKDKGFCSIILIVIHKVLDHQLAVTCYHCSPPTLGVIMNIIIWFKIMAYNNKKIYLEFLSQCKAIGRDSCMMLVAT